MWLRILTNLSNHLITELMTRQTRNMAMMMKKFVQLRTKTDQAHQVCFHCHSMLCSILVIPKCPFVLGLDDEESTTHPSEIDPNLIWPSMQDMNTRLRRVITSYQRNYKKEELKQQQKAKVGLAFITVNVDSPFPQKTFITTLRAFGKLLLCCF